MFKTDESFTKMIARIPGSGTCFYSSARDVMDIVSCAGDNDRGGWGRFQARSYTAVKFYAQRTIVQLITWHHLQASNVAVMGVVTLMLYVIYRRRERELNSDRDREIQRKNQRKRQSRRQKERERHTQGVQRWFFRWKVETRIGRKGSQVLVEHFKKRLEKSCREQCCGNWNL